MREGKIPNTPSKRPKTDEGGKKKDEDARTKKEKRQEQERIAAEKKAEEEKKRTEAENVKALKKLAGGNREEPTGRNPGNEGRKGSRPHIG